MLKKTLAVINNTVVIKLNDAKVSEWKVLIGLVNSKYRCNNVFFVLQVTSNNLHSPIGKLIWYAETVLQ